MESRSYYGDGYQDVQHRQPSIENARRTLKWTPQVTLASAVERTLDFFLRQAAGVVDPGASVDSPGGLEVLEGTRGKTGSAAGRTP